ncbi:hypothetical protein AMECASPLE_004770 [Ameca splendens]|uniref:Uncharacterized protein n=1 Tax=Ameca splendens TaxID=208324 RepID=A0ABV0XMX4_9TELE
MLPSGLHSGVLYLANPNSPKEPEAIHSRQRVVEDGEGRQCGVVLWKPTIMSTVPERFKLLVVLTIQVDQLIHLLSVCRLPWIRPMTVVPSANFRSSTDISTEVQSGKRTHPFGHQC